MANFDYLKEEPRFEHSRMRNISGKLYNIDPAASVINCRRAMVSVKWMYSLMILL